MASGKKGVDAPIVEDSAPKPHQLLDKVKPIEVATPMAEVVEGLSYHEAEARRG